MVESERDQEGKRRIEILKRDDRRLSQLRVTRKGRVTALEATFSGQSTLPRIIEALYQTWPCILVSSVTFMCAATWRVVWPGELVHGVGQKDTAIWTVLTNSLKKKKEFQKRGRWRALMCVFPSAAQRPVQSGPFPDFQATRMTATTNDGRRRSSSSILPRSFREASPHPVFVAQWCSGGGRLC